MRPDWPRLARLGHRWLALLVGVQLLAWTASGLYMVAVDLDFIHGDTLVRNLAPALRPGQAWVPVETLRAGRGDLLGLRLRAQADGQPVYELHTARGRELVDAVTGRPLGPLPEARIVALARAYYAGDGAVRGVRLLTDAASKPIELGTRPLPLWRVDFDDVHATSLYLRPDTGELAVRRHRAWRWFDFLWSLHIMDYRERSDVNNGLLRTAAPLALATALAGLWLCFHSFGFLQRRRRP